MTRPNRFKVLSAQIARADEDFTDEAVNTVPDLILDSKGRPIANVANALKVITNHPAWSGVLAFNEFTQERVLLKNIPGQQSGTFPRALIDEDYTAAQIDFNHRGFPTITKEVVVAVIRKACRENAFDPLRERLEGLNWDGTKRLDRWLTIYCGVEHSPYTSEVGIRWVISAVARALNPGCKADHMLVLEGAQGQRKSTALAVLAGLPWFSDSLPPMNSKDASSFLRGKWIIEIPELEAMRREVDAVKAFISRQVETYRPAYGREEVTEPRRCVFAGTTNKSYWLRDETGGRRFWPVKVGVIDLAALERDRDQLWAEAVTRFYQGERWWLEGEVAEFALSEAGERRPEDPWRSRIAEIIQDQQEITTKEVLSAMGIIHGDMTPALSKRVARELALLGWEKVGRITAGENKGAARYVPSTLSS